MGRHFKVRHGDVNRPFWLLDSPKSLTIQTVVILVSFVFFLWCLWKLPQENSEFPDGSIHCHPSSYRILNKRNATIKCKPCPECPAGQGQAVPCGSAIFEGNLPTCTECISLKTFSEEAGHGACKQCRTCSPRNTISHCTPEQDTQCGDCPRGYYQASQSLDSCKKCSSCCGGRRYAGLECHYLKQCKRTSCPQHMVTSTKAPQNIMDRLTTSAGRERHIRMAHQNVFEYGKLKDAGYSPTVEDTIAEKSEVKEEDNATLPNMNIPIDKPTNMREASSVRFQTKNSQPTTLDKFYHGAHQSSLSVTKARDENVDTAPEQKNTKPTIPLDSSYFRDLKKLLSIVIVIAVIAVIAVLVLIFIAVIVMSICWRIQPRQAQGSGCKITCCFSKGYLPLTNNSTPSSAWEFPEVSTASDNMADNSSVDEDADTTGLEGLTLAEIPLDLEDKLALKLDCRRKGESLYGWQKVGIKLEINEDILNNLVIEFETPAGSPTRALLYVLGSLSRTVAELVDALKSSDVNYRDVAIMVQKYYRDQRN